MGGAFLCQCGWIGNGSVNNKPLVNEFKERLEHHRVLERMLSEDKDGLIVDTMLLSYHHWTSVDLTPRVVLASYLEL